jgi:hypothetical protein
MRPFRGAGQNNKGYFSSGKVLLIANSSVGRKQEIERRFFRGIEQRAVVEPVPSSGLGRDDRVAGEGAGQALWRSVVKENEHRPGRNVAPALRR